MPNDELLEVAIPITPEQLIEQLKGAELARGEYIFTIDSNRVVVPALTNVTLALNLRPYVYIMYKHILTSDFYDSQFTFLFRIDDTKFVITPSQVAFETQKDLSISNYLPGKITYTYDFFNPFFFDIIVTIYIEAIRMERNLYENWYRLILKASEDKLSELAVSEGGISI